MTKYNLIQTILNIDFFKVSRNYLFYKIKLNDFSLFCNQKLIDEDNWGFHFFQEYIVLNGKDNTRILNNDLSLVLDLPFTFNENNFYNNTIIKFKDSLREGRGIYSANFVESDSVGIT